jgi:hypothetical protein
MAKSRKGRSMTDEAQAVKALVEQFRRLTDPASDPEAAVRDKLQAFMHDCIDARRSLGLSRDEGEVLLLEAAERNPGYWRTSRERLTELWRQTFTEPEHLPSLSPPAQLAWLGIETSQSSAIIDQALFRQFPALTPPERRAVWRETTTYFKREALGSAIQTAIFKAWYDVHKARGRTEGELVFGNCCRELGLIENRDGGQYLNFNNLVRVSDQEMRHATLAAAWKSAQEKR